MKAPDFWWTRPPSPRARLLAPLASIYGGIAARRMAGKGAASPVPVVCVGNFTAGGAGKTPTAIALAVALRDKGLKPVFLTRGYGGAVKSGATAIVDHNSRAEQVGDEALLLARIAPTVVAPDRAAGATVAAERLGADVIVMDDGLQNPALAKAVSIAVVDGARGIGNGLCMPAGPLRAPADFQAARVDAMLAIGPGPGVGDAMQLAAAARKPAFRASLSVDQTMADRLAGQRVLAFAGIGFPDKFFRTLTDLYARIEIARPFDDHHRFTDAEAGDLLAQAKARGLTLVTTEKDAARLKGSAALEALAAESLVLPVRIVLPRELAALVLEGVSPGR